MSLIISNIFCSEKFPSCPCGLENIEFTAIPNNCNSDSFKLFVNAFEKTIENSLYSFVPPK